MELSLEEGAGISEVLGMGALVDTACSVPPQPLLKYPNNVTGIPIGYLLWLLSSGRKVEESVPWT